MYDKKPKIVTPSLTVHKQRATRLPFKRFNSYYTGQCQLPCTVLMDVQNCKEVQSLGDWEQGWRSGESTRLPPMWSGFDSLSRCHMWAEFLVGSRFCSEGFSPDIPVFLPP